ncbi:MAG TPA: pilus assembly protein TadG-related protein [Phenylobacterium sp.]|jgi:Flp pilus assembly protein TadG
MTFSLRASLRRFLRSKRGNVAIMAALSLPALVGSLGLGAETATWYVNTKQMQNAADAAAIAAATNAASSYITEARAITGQYGFVNGAGGVNVTVSNTATCPDGSATCYSVTISRPQRLLLAQIVGYRGDTTIGNSPAKLITATAVALQSTTARPYCLLALGDNGVNTALVANGGPKADLSGCNVMSNTGAICNGHDLGADNGDAHTTNDGCGVVEHSNVPVVPDPYAALAANIPPDPCNGNYPQEPQNKKDPGLPSQNQLAGIQNWSGAVPMCGDVQLAGPVTVNTDGPAVLVIYNGQLDTNGQTLTTSSGSALTIVYAGTNGPYIHAPTGGGTLDVAAPKTGPWSGVVMYQDPALTTGVDISAAGNSPTWDLTGAVYLPHSTVTFSGIVNKASNGKSCFAMVVDNITINGTGSILEHGECAQAGLAMPTGQVPSRGKLVS